MANKAKYGKIRENKGRKKRSQEEERKVEGKEEIVEKNIGDDIKNKFKLVMICINSRKFDLRNTIKKDLFSAPQTIGKRDIGNEGFIGLIGENQGKRSTSSTSLS